MRIRALAIYASPMLIILLYFLFCHQSGKNHSAKSNSKIKLVPNSSSASQSYKQTPLGIVDTQTPVALPKGTVSLSIDASSGSSSIASANLNNPEHHWTATGERLWENPPVGEATLKFEWELLNRDMDKARPLLKGKSADELIDLINSGTLMQKDPRGNYLYPHAFYAMLEVALQMSAEDNLRIGEAAVAIPPIGDSLIYTAAILRSLQGLPDVDAYARLIYLHAKTPLPPKNDPKYEEMLDRCNCYCIAMSRMMKAGIAANPDDVERVAKEMLARDGIVPGDRSIRLFRVGYQRGEIMKERKPVRLKLSLEDIFYGFPSYP